MLSALSSPAQALHPRRDIGDDFVFIQRQVLALRHDYSPIANHRPHIAGAGAVNQARRHAVQGEMMRPAQIHQDDISQLARRQIAQFIGLPVNARALDRGDGQRLRNRQIGRIAC